MKEWRDREEEQWGNKARVDSAILTVLPPRYAGPKALGIEVENRAGLPKPLRENSDVFHVLSPSENRGARASRLGAADGAPQSSGALQPAWLAACSFGAIKQDDESAGLIRKGKVGNPTLLEVIALHKTLRRLSKF